jgi:type II secretory pathway component PulC
MKKNKKTYLLLGAVLVIWGVLGFKIIEAINPSEELIAMVKLPTTNFGVAAKKRDTFSITANYRDPFLGTMPKTKKPKKSKKKVVKKVETPKKNIAYAGSVAENGSNKRLFFISIEGQQHIMSQGETVAEVKLVTGNQENIKVRYGMRSETIAIQQ